MEGENPRRVISRLIVEKTWTKTIPITRQAASTRRNRGLSRTTRKFSSQELAVRVPRNPAGKANQATKPYRTEVAASPTNSHRKECLASSPAVAGPNAQPALKDIL